MGLDGLTQVIGLRESNWWLRLITGALFGIATVWLAYPIIDDSMKEIAQEISERLMQEALSGQGSQTQSLGEW